MEKPFDTLSASALRTLLIDEVKSFVECLDKASQDVLQGKRTQLIAIYKAVTEKEQLEMIPLLLGKNSTTMEKNNNFPQSMSDKGGT